MRLPVLAALVFGLVLAILMAGIRPGVGKGSAAEGETAPAATARRIVCVSPGLVEVLFTIGAGPKVVGCPDFLTAPPAALALPRVGGAFNPGLERILRLRPDLIVLPELVLDERAEAVAKVQMIIGFGYDNASLAEHRHPTRDELERSLEEIRERGTLTVIMSVEISGKISWLNTRQ